MVVAGVTNFDMRTEKVAKSHELSNLVNCFGGFTVPHCLELVLWYSLWCLVDYALQPLLPSLQSYSNGLSSHNGVVSVLRAMPDIHRNDVFRDQMPSAWITMILVQSSTAGANTSHQLKLCSSVLLRDCALYLSGLKVNEDKTEICLFSRATCLPCK